MTRLPALALLTLALAGCASAPKKPEAAASKPAVPATAPAQPAAGSVSNAPRVSPYAAAQEDPNTRGHYVAGGLYRPGVSDTVPDYIPNVDAIPEPEVVALERSRYGNRSPYTVLGQQYRVLDNHEGFVETGLASYYGNKFHGRRTSNLEVYDMYAFTAAHKSLPLPSFARVTNLDNGKSVVVRVNDRGPFHEGRVIDLSYAAAVKLGYRERGTARVEVRALMPGENALHRESDVRVAQTSAASGIDTLVQGLAPAAPSATAAVASTPRRQARQARNASRNAAAAAATPAMPVAAAAPPPVTSTAAIASAEAVTRVEPLQPNPAGERFQMHQNGRTMTADEFDAWMAQRQLRVATGQPTTIATAAAQTSAAPPATPVVAMAGPAPVAVANAAGGERITLQVASFANRDNAGIALQRLLGANITGARLLDADVDGRRIWRLRIGPVDAAQAPELMARVTGLGFATPQRVRD